MLSSAEAELHGIVKASSESMGMRSLCRDLAMKIDADVLTDASAALAIVSRQGVGRVRHLDTSLLWIQEKAARKEIVHCKVDGKENPADILTKAVPSELIERHCGRLQFEFKSGRADLAPDVMMTMKENEKEDDRWEVDENVWLRAHKKPRRTLFTPMKVRQGPKSEEIKVRRRTVGIQSNGTVFDLADDWTQPKAHRDMGSTWTGVTAFQKC